MINADFIDTMKRMILESESILDCIERDPGANLMWMGNEFEMLQSAIKETKEELRYIENNWREHEHTTSITGPGQ